MYFKTIRCNFILSSVWVLEMGECPGNSTEFQHVEVTDFHGIRVPGHKLHVIWPGLDQLGDLGHTCASVLLQ